MKSAYRHALLLSLLVTVATCQQQCYFGRGQAGPANLVPCVNSGSSACCLLGDVCLSGNACYDYNSGTTYQYGCTDSSYTDQTCPFKCGFDKGQSPWTGLMQCTDVDGVNGAWVCHSPENCQCSWTYTTNITTIVPKIGCAVLGSLARIALFAPTMLAPYVLLPATYGGSTGYWSATTVSGSLSIVPTVVQYYTPSIVTPFTTYIDPRSIVRAVSGVTPDTAATQTTSNYNVPSVSSTLVTTTIVAAQTSTSSTALSSTTAATSVQVTDVTDGSQSTSSSKRLSTAQIAGTSIGAIAGAIILASIMMVCCPGCCRRKQTITKRHYSDTSLGVTSIGLTPLATSAGLSNASVKANRRRSMPTQCAELPARSSETRMAPQTQVAEMDGGSQPPRAPSPQQTRSAAVLAAYRPAPAVETQHHAAVAGETTRPGATNALTLPEPPHGTPSGTPSGRMARHREHDTSNDASEEDDSLWLGNSETSHGPTQSEEECAQQ